jgi:hypothetical protein
MPSPRNRLKLTGNTHLPDVGDEIGGDEDVLRFVPAQESEREAPSATMAAESAASGYVAAVREQVRQRPVTALAGAFVLGVVVARL